MTATTLISHENKIPDEIRIKYLNLLSIPELLKCAQVCKNWFEISCDKEIWQSFFKQLNPLRTTHSLDDPNALCSKIFLDLRKNAALANGILCSISTDAQLATLCNDPFQSLEALRKKPRIERSFLLLKSARENCAPLLKLLIEKHHIDLEKHKQEKGCFINRTTGQVSVTGYYQNNPSLPLFYKLLFDRSMNFSCDQVMGSLFSLFDSDETAENAVRACASIVKSHPDLSAFFNTNIHFHNESIPAAEFIYFDLMPLMGRLELPVVLQDWTQCGFKAQEEWFQ